ncbi:MAG TPA: type II secretion system protein, partial [Phycisphaerae bacterium]|nr:type II secretion system protein [Phycisphaerae bacterium]
MDSRPKTNNSRFVRAGAGFTLIEVLVVVAIIALLVAILLPSLQKARWQAKVIACQGHLHDLGNAFQMYANTYAGYFPRT